jgi:hypothetical protein
MKKNLLILMLVLLSSTGFAQYVFSGTVMTSTSVPVVGQTVYVYTDSIKWNSSMSPTFTLSAVTNSAGAYSVTLPSSITSGHPIMATTVNCTGPWLANTHTYAGVNITSNFTKCIPPPPPSISGKIYTGSTGAANAKVYLIDKHLDTITSSVWVLTARDSAVTNSTGDYTMGYPVYVAGSLLLKAALLPASSVYASYMPTYYTSSLIWSGATSLPSSSTVTANISLISGTNPGGPGFVGGSVLLGANKTTAVGDPVPNRLILLTDGSNNAVAYTKSDASGNFAFLNLPYGTYKIFGDVGGKTSAPLTFVLSAQSPSANSIQFKETSKTFDATLFASSVNNITAVQAIAVYPNPVTNMLNIAGLNAIKGDKDAILSDVTGKQIGNYHFAANADATINTSSLSSGLYILQVTTTEGTATLKISK